ncbi:MAG: TIGR01906 family membrane protein [Clostridia bacterium]|nr:TIGR01906 family membrane protein [Clostridia bacterium]
MNAKYRKPLNITLTAVFATALTLFIITFAIGLPIYCRFFYYIQIKTLKMEEATGWSYQTIKTAYDEVLNYLTLPGHAFGTGALAWTESEAAHFADCKVLFNLNLSVLIISGAICLTLILLDRFKVIEFARIKGHRAYLVSAVVVIALPLIIGVLAAIDFDRAFVVFHAIFFPGKDNWTFNPNTEQIIEVMPEEFFMNCAIIIGVGLIAFALALIIADVVLTRRDKKRAALEKDANQNNSAEG